MKERGWSKTVKRALGRGGDLPTRRVRPAGPVFIPFRRSVLLVASLSLLALIVGAAMWLEPNDARGEETAGAPQPGPGVPTAAQTKELLESGQALPLTEQSETDLHAAQTMPHRDLGRGEALELAEAVFEPELESTGGVFDELEPIKYLSNYAAVVPSSSLSGSFAAEHPDAGVLLESSLPLRTEDAQGQEEPVDLSLEESEGELQPRNPLAEVGIPEQLGEGVSLPAQEVEVSVVGAPASVAASDVEESFAFYPGVAEDTDLIVAPTATGMETLTDIRSAEAPQATTYRLSLPAGASLESTRGGGAEVTSGGRATVVIPPPTATDAAGDPVPVDMTVEGDELTVAISPGSSPAYPVMVDPNYELEYWCWSGCGAGFYGWAGSSTNASYGPEWGAQWDPSHYNGLDLTAGYPGPAYSGTHADWSYWVPRYSQDIGKYGTPPTTFVSNWMAEGVLFLPFGNSSNYPAMVIGLIEPATGWAPNAWVHYGGQGELANWGNVLVSNPGSNPAIKGADENLVTYEYEAQAKYRDTFIGESTMEVVDVDAPRILELTPPTGWLTGTSASIGYGFEDTGLGVWSSGIGLPGEVPLHKGWGTGFGCTGTNVSPCPRVVRSSEAGAKTLAFNPSELATGEDQLEVVVGDPLWSEGHVATKIVPVKIDNKAPEVELSGALTEEEKLGTLKSEYPLAIKATDGTEADPQSGVSRVEVKVDGKTKSTWTPGCATKNCSFSGAWTLKTSEYTAASHEVEVLVTDAAGNVFETTIEVDLGQAPPQTSFTSAHPSYENHEIKTIGFKATRGGAPVGGVTYECTLAETNAEGAVLRGAEKWSGQCSSPFELPAHMEEGWHTFTAAAKEGSGTKDPTPATWTFETAAYPAAPIPSEKLVYPEEGKKTASYYTLEAEWGADPEGRISQGVTGITFEMELPGWTDFKPVPEECVVDGQGRPVSWPIKAKTHPGHNAPVYLKVRGCPVFEAAKYPEAEIKFRATFDGGTKVAGASPAAVTEFVSRYNANRVSTDAVESVGPASVDLLTGAFSLSRTDVSIPVPGYEANLEFTRTYNSTIDKSLPGYSLVMGGAWQPASPMESEGESEPWTRLEEKVIPSHPEVNGYYCWEYKTVPAEHPEEEGEEEEREFEKQCPGSVHEYCPQEWCESWVEEEAQPRESWIELLDSEGSSIPFEISPGGQYVSPEWAKELVLRREGESVVLSYPNGTHIIFAGAKPASEQDRFWLPHFMSFQANPQSMRMIYTTGAGKDMQLHAEVAPSPVTCPDEAQHTAGCRMLLFNYTGFMETGLCSITWTQWEQHGEACPSTLKTIEYFGPSGSGLGQTVASYEYKAVGGWASPGELQLVAEKDPRTGLTEKYSYEPGSIRLSTLTPPGQSPWEFSYLPPESSAAGSLGKLKSVRRGGATTTLAYEVPIKGAGAPYDLSPESIAKWGETDLPVDATAVFPANHVPGEYPPHAYTGATVHYMDPEGYEVNTAAPSPPGVSGQSISTTETDVKGNVVRELSPRARLLALESPESAAVSHQLDSHSVYNAAGTEMLESWGPLHPARLESSGEPVEAREHTVTRYDEGEPTPPAGTPPAYLPTKETTAVVVSGKSGEFEPKVTLTRYEWAHRLPEETVVDPTGLDIRSVTKYNGNGQLVETRQPKAVAAEEPLTGGNNAGDTVTLYYRMQAPHEAEGECVSTKYVNLPCEILPAKQESSGTTRPELLVTKYTAYNELGEPERIVESPGGGTANARTTITEYDGAGRPWKTEVTGGGVELARTKAKTETVYSPTLGWPTEQKFLCVATNCTGFDNQATKTTYNALGQVTEYEDADGAKTETTYDAFGRPATVKDPRGTETMHYDEASGALTSMEVSGVGTFTAAYDADGDLIRRGLPNGLTANTTYNVAGEPTKLTYTKQSSCGSTGCTWYEESLERSAEGMILAGEAKVLAEPASQVNNHYKYDAAGRLTEATEKPSGGQCTSREYKYDLDSNRLSKTTRPGVGGACATSGGSTQPYSYDNADRLIGPTYDAFGRITGLPAEFAGGKAGEKPLETEYFANDMVAMQSQNGVTNTFQLDSTGRQRQREQLGGVKGVEIFHYDGPGDSPSWTALGSTWSRNIPGIGGELAAVQGSNGTTTFELTDLHGDVVASASSSSIATALLGTSRFSEFGEPESGATGRFGWLGGKSRRTELSSGVIQMGARSYIPQLGRFLSPDPIRQGSANAYDYADQDPVNGLDLSGESAKHKATPAKRNYGPLGGHSAHTKLLKSHTIRASAQRGAVHAFVRFTASTTVTVRAWVTFRGVTGAIHQISSAQSHLIVAVTPYPGVATTGEIAHVCIEAFSRSQGEGLHCYKTPVYAPREPEPQPEIIQEPFPFPVSVG